MLVLVCADNYRTAQFLAHGLHYESVYTEVKNLHDELTDRYDLIVCKIFSPIDEYLEKHILKMSDVHTVFLLTHQNNVPKSLQNTERIKHFPYDIPVRLLGYRIKHHIYTERFDGEITELTAKDLTLNLDTREAYRYGEKYYLRNKEFRLLEFFMKNQNKVLSRMDLLENVWDRNTNMLTHTVDVHINKLRKKIDRNPDDRLIKTVFCRGYILKTLQENDNN